MREIVITCPHSYCLDTQAYKKNHFCDFRAEECAKILKTSCKNAGLKVHYFVNENTPRVSIADVKGCDLNRIRCRRHEWRTEITKTLTENKNIIALIDVHSYPDVINFGGSDITILYDSPNNNTKMPQYVIEINKEINNALYEDQVYCNLLYGKNNDIIDESIGLGLPAFLLEFVEDKNRLSNYSVQKVCDKIAKYYSHS